MAYSGWFVTELVSLPDTEIRSLRWQVPGNPTLRTANMHY